MKIAVTYENGQIFQHFGHTQFFKVYDLDDNGNILSAEVVDTNGQGHGALAGLLYDHDIRALICGGIGGGAQMALRQCGIHVFGGCSGDADEAIKALAAGTLQYDPNVQCSHHGEGHEHSCGSHGCNSHTCG